MTTTQYEEILQWISPLIIKSSHWREAITPNERFSVTLRYIATGDAQITIATAYRNSPAVIGRIIKETLPRVMECIARIWLFTSTCFKLSV